MGLERPAPQAIVVFGASGDLAKRKVIPALYNLSREGLLPDPCVIVGFSRSDWDDDAFREHARASIREFSRTPLEDTAWKTFAGTLSYVSGGIDDATATARLVEKLDQADGAGCGGGRLYYLAVPPEAFPVIVRGLGAIGANTPTSRIVIEKPFGHDLESARDLTRQIHEVFTEPQVFRIDHYLGKDTVQNIVVFRFGNALFERVWNRDAIAHIQLTVAESIGIEGRAGYYEHAGAIRDLLQNHMLQVLTLLTMEPPRSFEGEAYRDEKVKLLEAIRPLDPADVVRGQYDGYRAEPGVDLDSRTETFVAARLFIDNWRWQGVPVYLRHGKRLPRRCTEISVLFCGAPDYLFKAVGIPRLPADQLTIRIQPNEGISLAFQAKVPGPGYELQTVRMDFDYEASFKHEPAEAYERLLHDAMEGDQVLFTREDAVERSWEIVTPVLDAPVSPHPYAPGTWGPVEAERMIAPQRWHLRKH